jgi:phosphoribosylanthranilate isomerase
MVKVKICGITRPEDAFFAVDEGVDALGFMFYKESPRYIDPETAKGIILALPPFVKVVGVFVNEDPERIVSIVHSCSIDLIQLHGDETPEFCNSLPGQKIKAIRVKDHESLKAMQGFRVSAFLLDTYRPEKRGGTGEAFDWRLAVRAKRYGRLVLAGGLNPQNVAKAIEFVKPYGVDVSTGVEISPGRKDRMLIRNFLSEVRKGSLRS